MVQVAVIIVNWNGRADTLECLSSVVNDTYPDKQVIVVDNGSSDGSVAAVRAAFPKVEILETGRNLGFTGGNNFGIQCVLSRPGRCDYFYLLNNDTSSESDALSRLVSAAEGDMSFGMLTPLIHYFDQRDKPWFAGSTIDLSRGVAVHNNRPENEDAKTTVRELAWASGCAMLIRREYIERLNGFDDRFFLIWEDVDLSLRLRKLGAKIGLVPTAKIYHKVSRSISGISTSGCYYHLRNNLLLIRQHGGGGSASVIGARLRDAARSLREGRREGWGQLAAIGAACRDHWMGRYGPRRTTDNSVAR